jgi:spectrin beta
MAQEDRFNALRNLTTLEKKRQLPPVEPRQSRLPIYLDEFKTWEERDAERSSSRIKSTIKEERTSVDGNGRPITSGKQRSSQEFDSTTGKRRSESATRLPTIKEGFLSRKHEWEGYERKATHRAWEKYYSALTSNRLSFYKDAKHLKTGRTVSDDLILDISTNAAPATDYRKKPNVFRLKLQNGNEYLFHAKDDIEMNEWINAINNCVSSLLPITSTTQIPSIALTSPPTTIGTSSTRQPTPAMVSSTSGVEMSQQSSGSEQKSRTLPLRSSSAVEPPVSSQQQQQPQTGKKKSGGFFSMKRK